MSLLANSNAIESGGYNIDRSLRFRSSASAYLNRTAGASATNQYIATTSIWFKRGALGTTQRLLEGKTALGDTGLMTFQFESNDQLAIWGYATTWRQTSQVFRDPSAWYHLVVTVDTTQATASNRVKVYLNGSQITAFGTSNNPTQNTTFGLNNNSTALRLCTDSFGLSRYFDGYLAEVNFIDGQALTPSSFGETSTETGVWVPKKYTGTYGTNGFYLNFSDNTSATTLAYDKSGNGNNWTANNISTTAGYTYDSMTDVPTLTSATAANYCVLNPLFTNTAATNSVSDGNLKLTSPSVANSFVTSTISMTSGKFYFEVTAGSIGAGGMTTGIWQLPILNGTAFSSQTNYRYYSIDGKIYNSAGGNPQSYSTYGTNDIIGVALDLDNGKVYYSKNGTWQGSSDPATQTNPAVTGLTGEWVFGVNVGTTSGNYAYANFGQRPFSYTPPTGFKALNTFNLPDPTIKKPNQYMDVTAYTGNGGTQAITNGGFQPDFVWMKKRSAAESHILQNSTTGTTKFLMSNSTAAEDTSSAIIQSFDASGFTVGASSVVNGAATTYVGWQWKESATAGFDIVTYTGNGTSGRTVAHNLGVAPKFTIIKQRNASNAWNVWAYANNAGDPDSFGELNSTAAWYQNQGSSGPYTVTPSSTVLTLTDYGQVNGNGNTYVAYLFAEIPGFSKFGSYTGNGSSDGPFVYCGFRPRYVMVKRTDSTSDWGVYDSARDTYNQMTDFLFPNGSYAETAGYPVDFLSNGFKSRNSAGFPNASGGTYIFCAFSENPFKYSNAR